MAAFFGLAIAGGATAQTYDSTVTRVTERVTARDCAGALALLQTGLAENRPAVALLAGTMYERGVCLKPNWDTAVGHYIVAHNGGERAAASRLAAGYAAPMGGPDPAAALWWLNQSDLKSLGEPCVVPVAERADPDRFVAVLQTWTPARVAGCNYVAGLLATLSGEVKFSREIAMVRQPGELHARIKPALAAIDIWTSNDSGVFGAAEAPEAAFMRRATRPASVENAIRKIADAALARYPQPPGLDPGWVQDVGIRYGQAW